MSSSLQSEYELLQKVFNTNPTPVVVLNRDGHITHANRQAETLFGISRDTITARNFSDPQWNIVDFDGNAISIDELPFAKVRRTRKPVSSMHHAVKLDSGTMLLLNVDATPLFDADGDFDGMVAVLEDITDKIMSERALAESEAMLRSVFRAAPVGIGVVKNRVLTWVNQKLIEMVGYSENELIGRSSLVLYPTREEYEYVGREKYRQIGLYGTGSVETCWKRSDGTVINVLLSSTPIDLDNLQHGVTFSALEITERKQMEERLRHSEKMEAIGQLAGGVAHDFNNQLAGIMGYADLLQYERMDDPAVRGYAAGILDAARRAADLTSQLLAFARKGKYLSVAVDLHRIVPEVASLLKHSINKNIVIRQLLAADPSTARGDPSQLQNAVLNLALNARDAMPSGGELTIKTSVAVVDEVCSRSMMFDISSGSYLCVAVRDTGRGIDPQDVHRIFEPFYTTKEEGKGTGLGLAAVYGTMKNHHGGISVETGAGNGTEVTLYLPLLVSESTEGRSPVIAGETGGPDALAGRHIMVVDDEEHNRQVTAMMIESMGGRVTVCADGQEALDTYSRSGSDIDVVVLDLVMPNMDGGTAFRRLKAINPEVVVIVSSGYSIDGDAQQLLMEGARDFIQKPFLKIELAARLSTILHSL